MDSARTRGGDRFGELNGVNHEREDKFLEQKSFPLLVFVFCFIFFLLSSLSHTLYLYRSFPFFPPPTSFLTLCDCFLLRITDYYDVLKLLRRYWNVKEIESYFPLILSANWSGTYSRWKWVTARRLRTAITHFWPSFFIPPFFLIPQSSISSFLIMWLFNFFLVKI